MKIFPDGPNAISDCEMLPIKNLTSLFLLTDRVFLGFVSTKHFKEKSHTPSFSCKMQKIREHVEAKATISGKKLSLKVVSLSNGVDNNDDDVEVDRDV